MHIILINFSLTLGVIIKNIIHYILKRHHKNSSIYICSIIFSISWILFIVVFNIINYCFKNGNDSELDDLLEYKSSLTNSEDNISENSKKIELELTDNFKSNNNFSTNINAQKSKIKTRQNIITNDIINNKDNINNIIINEDTNINIVNNNILLNNHDLNNTNSNNIIEINNNEINNKSIDDTINNKDIQNKIIFNEDSDINTNTNNILLNSTDFNNIANNNNSINEMNNNDTDDIKNKSIISSSSCDSIHFEFDTYESHKCTMELINNDRIKRKSMMGKTEPDAMSNNSGYSSIIHKKKFYTTDFFCCFLKISFDEFTFLIKIKSFSGYILSLIYNKKFMFIFFINLFSRLQKLKFKKDIKLILMAQ